MKVLFTPSAQGELVQVINHIASENPAAAIKMRQRIADALRRLETFPQSGRIIPEFPTLDYREVIVRPYRFFYAVRDDTVWIVAVWHSAQLPNSP